MWAIPPFWFVLSLREWCEVLYVTARCHHSYRKNDSPHSVECDIVMIDTSSSQQGGWDALHSPCQNVGGCILPIPRSWRPWWWFLPEAETVAYYSCSDVVEAIVTNRSPDTVVVDLETSCTPTASANQSHRYWHTYTHRQNSLQLHLVLLSWFTLYQHITAGCSERKEAAEMLLRWDLTLFFCIFIIPWIM